MASRAVENIGRVQDKVWPEVQRALDQITRGIKEVAEITDVVDKEVEIYFSKTDGGKSKRRTTVNETVWILQRMGLLRGGQEAELIKAAIDVAKELREELQPDEWTAAERRFIEAVDSLPDWKE